MVLRRAETATSTGLRPRIDRERGRLVGSLCERCGARSWPARAVCSACGSDELVLETLPAVGRLLSFTTVWVARKGITPPYVLGQVDLGGGASVFAHVRGLPMGATVPADVRIALASDPGQVPSFWFEPSQEEEET